MRALIRNCFERKVGLPNSILIAKHAESEFEVGFVRMRFWIQMCFCLARPSEDGLALDIKSIAELQKRR